MQKHCAKCSVPFECAAPEPGCWCESVPTKQGVRATLREEYSGCLCKTCLLLASYHPSTL